MQQEASNPVQDKSYKFALQVVLFTKGMMDRKEFVLSRQLLRSGTSVGANIEEAIHAQSKKDFVNKLSIALKEANETRYWLLLIHDSHIYADPDGKELFLLTSIKELIALLTAIIKTSRKTMK